MQNSIHECLIEREPYSQPLKFLPALATSWRMIQPTVMEMKLRKGVKFHDGSTMEADDVAFSLNRIWQRTRPQYDGAQGRFFYNFDRVEIVDPLTVRIHTKRPEPLIEVLLSDKCAGIVSKKYHDKVGFEKADLAPVGAGPYRVVSFKARHQLVLERFNDYWGEKAPLDKITFTAYPGNLFEDHGTGQWGSRFYRQHPPRSVRARSRIEKTSSCWMSSGRCFMCMPSV